MVNENSDMYTKFQETKLNKNIKKKLKNNNKINNNNYGSFCSPEESRGAAQGLPGMVSSQSRDRRAPASIVSFDSLIIGRVLGLSDGNDTTIGDNCDGGTSI